QQFPLSNHYALWAESKKGVRTTVAYRVIAAMRDAGMLDRYIALCDSRIEEGFPSDYLRVFLNAQVARDGAPSPETVASVFKWDRGQKSRFQIEPAIWSLFEAPDFVDPVARMTFALQVLDALDALDDSKQKPWRMILAQTPFYAYACGAAAASKDNAALERLISVYIRGAAELHDTTGRRIRHAERVLTATLDLEEDALFEELATGLLSDPGFGHFDLSVTVPQLLVARGRHKQASNLWSSGKNRFINAMRKKEFRPPGLFVHCALVNVYLFGSDEDIPVLQSLLRKSETIDSFSLARSGELSMVNPAFWPISYENGSVEIGWDFQAEEMLSYFFPFKEKKAGDFQLLSSSRIPLGGVTSPSVTGRKSFSIPPNEDATFIRSKNGEFELIAIEQGQAFQELAPFKLSEEKASLPFAPGTDVRMVEFPLTRTNKVSSNPLLGELIQFEEGRSYEIGGWFFLDGPLLGGCGIGFDCLDSSGKVLYYYSNTEVDSRWKPGWRYVKKAIRPADIPEGTVALRPTLIYWGRITDQDQHLISHTLSDHLGSRKVDIEKPRHLYGADITVLTRKPLGDYNNLPPSEHKFTYTPRKIVTSPDGILFYASIPGFPSNLTSALYMYNLQSKKWRWVELENVTGVEDISIGFEDNEILARVSSGLIYSWNPTVHGSSPRILLRLGGTSGDIEGLMQMTRDRRYLATVKTDEDGKTSIVLITPENNRLEISRDIPLKELGIHSVEKLRISTKSELLVFPSGESRDAAVIPLDDTPVTPGLKDEFEEQFPRIRQDDRGTSVAFPGPDGEEGGRWLVGEGRVSWNHFGTSTIGSSRTPSGIVTFAPALEGKVMFTVEETGIVRKWSIEDKIQNAGKPR
ncbi:MAG: hypothetical protein AAGJ79_07710, partial [Verrucomicrobiota bacterium]